MMKLRSILIAVFTLLVSSLSLAADANFKIGVLDMQQIMQQSPQAATLNKQLQVQFQPRQQKIIAARDALQNEANKLNKDGAVMNNADRAKLQDKIIADRASYQAMVQSFQHDLSEAQNQAMQKFVKQLDTAVNTVAKQGGYTIVVQRAVVPYLDPSIDITKEVLKTMSGNKA